MVESRKDFTGAGFRERGERMINPIPFSANQSSSYYTLPTEDDLFAFRDNPAPKPDWVIEGMEPGDVGLLTAPGGIGKSMLCLSLASAVASGQPIFGQWQVGTPGDVLYMYAEDSARVMHRRFHALCRLLADGGNGMTDSILRRLHFICVRNNPPKLMIRGQ